MGVVDVVAFYVLSTPVFILLFAFAPDFEDLCAIIGKWCERDCVFFCSVLFGVGLKANMAFHIKAVAPVLS